MAQADDVVDQVSLNHSENESSPTDHLGIEDEEEDCGDNSTEYYDADFYPDAESVSQISPNKNSSDRDPPAALTRMHSEKDRRPSPPGAFAKTKSLIFGRKEYKALSHNEPSPPNQPVETNDEEENIPSSTMPFKTKPTEGGHYDHNGIWHEHHSSYHSICPQQLCLMLFLASCSCITFIVSIIVLVFGAHHTRGMNAISAQKPTNIPSLYPTEAPATTPALTPFTPSSYPTVTSTSTHNYTHSSIPSPYPTVTPTLMPTLTPSSIPSPYPTVTPTPTPTLTPSFTPSSYPTVTRTASAFKHTYTHSFVPSPYSIVKRTSTPTLTPSFTPSTYPTVTPTLTPSLTPSKDPTIWPTSAPSSIPSLNPTTNPTPKRVNAPSSPRPTQLPTISHAPTRAYPSIQPRPKIGSLALGRSHSCAITKDSKDLLCLGNNDHGQLGDGTILSRKTPAIISLGQDTYATHIAAGNEYTCAITNIGALMCWGKNEYGNIGDGTKTDRHTPTTIPLDGTDKATQIALGPHHTCAITNTNALLCWGANDYGQVGANNVTGGDNRVTEPTIILSPDTPNEFYITKVALGGYHTCAITNTKKLLCWGLNNYGQLGDGTTVTKAELVTISLGTDILGADRFATGISLGMYHTCVITNTDELLCWGHNNHGQLGDGTKEDRYLPTTIPLDNDSFAKEISLGVYHTCAITNTIDIICWGWNNFGQLGNEIKDDRLRPTIIPSLSTRALSTTQVALGWFHTCAVTNSNEAQCWGDNRFGQLGDGTRDNRSIPSLAFGGG